MCVGDGDAVFGENEAGSGAGVPFGAAVTFVDAADDDDAGEVLAVELVGGEWFSGELGKGECGVFAIVLFVEFFGGGGLFVVDEFCGLRLDAVVEFHVADEDGGVGAGVF